MGDKDKIGGSLRDRFEDFIRSVQDEIVAYARGQFGDEHLALDLCQEALLGMYRKLAGGQTIASWKGYLFVSVRNAVWRHYRQKAKQPAVSLEEAYACEAGRAETAPGEEEEIQSLLKDLEGLPPKLREPVLLRLFHDLNFGEIGEILGLPNTTVRSQYNLAVKKLQTLHGQHRKDHEI